jgi:serine protease DegQ
MRKTWLIFSQAVTVALALLFVVGTLKPEWLHRRDGAQAPPVL